MARRLKRFAGLSTLALSSAIAAASCDQRMQGPPPAAEPAAETLAPKEDHAAAAAPVAGAESEGGAMEDAAHDLPVYLSALQIIRGHLRAGIELYVGGDRAMGPQHMRHPQAEILTSLAPALKVRGAVGVEAAIEALALAGDAGAAPAEIAAAHQDAIQAIFTAARATQPTVKDLALAAANTLTIAADEYSVAVKNGVIVNLHEYHDAYGFIAVVIDDLSNLTGANDAEKAVIATALEQARLAASAAPAPVPPAGALAPASTIYGAAARIEIAARAL